MSPRSAKRGAVLVVVVLLALALLGLAHGLLLAARLEVSASSAGARHLEARALAEAVARGGAGASDRSWMDTVRLWGEGARTSRRHGFVEATRSLRRLGPESWLLEVGARHDRGARATAARLLWVLDPVERLSRVEGVVAVGPGSVAVVEGEIDGGSVSGVGSPSTAAACAPWHESLVDVVASLPPLAELPAASTGPLLGAVELHRIVSEARRVSASVVAPSPVEAGGVCLVDEPGNWGDPDRPLRPCGAYVPVLSREGGLTVGAGSGQGVLAVDGDVHLEAGVSFAGVVVASGHVVVSAGAEVTGMIESIGGVTIERGGRVTGSSCRAARALAALRSSTAGALVLEEPVGPL